MSIKLNILVAYPYMKPNVIDLLKERQNDIRFLLDSGAFTAWKAGTTIDVNEYCDFIESLPFKPWRYFALDVVGDHEATMKNFVHMIDRGLKPIPIFTRGQDISVLDEYYKHSDVVGLGGLVGTKGNKGFVKGIMEHVGDRKVHWLGFNNKDFLSYYKPYMCDSSSWLSAVKFASCNLYDVNGRWTRVGKQDFAKKPTERVWRIISKYGMDMTRLADKGQWKNSGSGEYAIEELTCKSWSRYQIDVGRKLDINFFLACACHWEIKLLHQAHQFWLTQGFHES